MTARLSQHFKFSFDSYFEQTYHYLDTGQFNFDADELAFINTHAILIDHQPLVGASVGLTYRLAGWSLSLDAIYSSGLRGGFADQEALLAVVQVNASLERKFRPPGIGAVTDRITILNLTDRVNEIRPAEGIGISFGLWPELHGAERAVYGPVGLTGRGWDAAGPWPQDRAIRQQ